MHKNNLLYSLRWYLTYLQCTFVYATSLIKSSTILKYVISSQELSCFQFKYQNNHLTTFYGFDTLQKNHFYSSSASTVVWPLSIFLFLISNYLLGNLLETVSWRHSNTCSGRRCMCAWLWWKWCVGDHTSTITGCLGII